MKLTAALAAAAFVLLWPAAAQARNFTSRVLSDAKVGRSHDELVAQRDYSKAVVEKLRGSWTVAPRHATCWSHVPWSRVCDRARRRMLAHRWLEQVAERRLAALEPAVRLGPSWLVSAFLCIHRYEGSWDSTSNPDYRGGLQFGWTEWSTYGGRYAPTADRATPAEQIAAGIAYYHADGDSFAPWPNSSRACGLR